ncbi:MAG TPA: hypothetical protein VEN82_04030, partial [Actinomycetota bacterium]|nr:hypothetical protein [Actinomycetota bacterium]
CLIGFVAFGAELDPPPPGGRLPVDPVPPGGGFVVPDAPAGLPEKGPLRIQKIAPTTSTQTETNTAKPPGRRWRRNDGP